MKWSALQEVMRHFSAKEHDLYKERNLKEENLTEPKFRSLILEHYTFLKTAGYH
jgi:hypothetical protein